MCYCWIQGLIKFMCSYLMQTLIHMIVLDENVSFGSCFNSEKQLVKFHAKALCENIIKITPLLSFNNAYKVVWFARTIKDLSGLALLVYLWASTLFRYPAQQWERKKWPREKGKMSLWKGRVEVFSERRGNYTYNSCILFCLFYM